MGVELSPGVRQERLTILVQSNSDYLTKKVISPLLKLNTIHDIPYAENLPTIHNAVNTLYDGTRMENLPKNYRKLTRFCEKVTHFAVFL
jgi:hypothetical protein